MADQKGLGQRITSAFHNGELDLSLRPGAPKPGWDGMPEVAVANRLRRVEATDAEIRLFITFTAAMDRARDADRLWDASGRLFVAHKWPYKPEEVGVSSISDLAGILRSYGVSQRHSVDSAGWHTIANSLATSARAQSVRTAIYEGKGDARELLRSLLAKSVDGRPLFPLLQGPKIGVMWVRMLAHPGGASIASLGTLPVAVDVQVRKVTEYLGMTETYGRNLEQVRRLIQEAWATDVQRYGAVGPDSIAGSPAALDPALWFYGKWGCTRCEHAGRKLPISQICQQCRFDVLHRRGI